MPTTKNASAIASAQAAAASQAAAKATSYTNFSNAVKTSIGSGQSAISALGKLVNSKGPATTAAQKAYDVAAAQSATNLAAAQSAGKTYQSYVNAPGVSIPEPIIDNTDTMESQGAFDALKAEFEKYGLGSLVDDIKGLIQSGASSGTMALALQNTDAYKQRFSANADRIAKGLTALKPADYLAAEDSYQNIMRNYGLPASYYAKDSTGKQAGFNQLLANDVSAVELEDRVATAQNRVINANPDVTKALKSFYPDITNGDILAYTLDPTKALDMIKRKVTAAEIGGAALSSGLTTEAASAENLARYGVTAAQAKQGYASISEMLPRASTLSDIYKQGPYDQAAAEADVFNTAGNAAAKAKRKQLTALEQSQFAGSSGGASSALSRDRAMSPMMLGVPGAGAF
jgi:hypothetical protein